MSLIRTAERFAEQKNAMRYEDERVKIQRCFKGTSYEK